MFQEERVNSDKSASLYTKFNDEADKIRAWKAQAEFSLRLKDQKLNELSQIISNLKARLVESQKELKSLNLKLQQEEEHKQDVVNKNAANRELCHELKNWVTRITNQLEKAEAEKAELMSILDSQKGLVEDLSLKFKSLIMDSEEKSKSASALIKQKQSENQSLHENLHSISSAFQKQVDEKNAEILDLRTAINELHNDLDNVSAQLETCEEAKNELERNLQERSHSLEEALTSLSTLERRRVEQECHINSLQDVKSKLESDSEHLLNRLSEMGDENDGLKNKLEDVIGELKKTNQSLCEKIDEISLIRNDLNCVLDANHILQSEKSDLENQTFVMTELVGKMKVEIDCYKSTVCEAEMNLNKFNEEISVKYNEISTLNDDILSLGNEKKLLESSIDLKSEQIAGYITEMEHKKNYISNLEKDCELLQGSLDGVSKEKEVLEQHLKDVAADYETQLQNQRTLFERDLSEKQELIECYTKNQEEQSLQIQELQAKCDLEEIETLSKSVAKLLEERASIEKIFKETSSQHESGRKSLQIQFECSEEQVKSLQKELSNMAANLAFSLNKCKSEYDHLLRAKGAELEKLEAKYKSESEALKIEVQYYKTESAQIRSQSEGPRKRMRTFAQSQDCLLGRSDLQSKKSGIVSGVATKSYRKNARTFKSSASVTSSPSPVGFISWIDSDPIFG